MKIKKKKIRVLSVVSTIVLSLYAVIMLYAFFFGFITSVKADLDFQWNPFGLPSEQFGWHFENYKIAYQIMYVEVFDATSTEYVRAGTMYFNTILYAGLASALNVFFALLVAYCCNRFKKYAVTKWLYVVAIIVMTIPIVGSLPSQMMVMQKLNVYDTIFWVFLAKSSYASSYFLIFYAAYRGISNTYYEAAELDGAGHWRTYFSIAIPMVVPVITSVFILLFITYWNDYTTAMMFWPSRPLITRGLYEFQTSRNKYATEPVKMAATFIVCLPTMLLFIIFQKKIMSNVTMGGLKG